MKQSRTNASILFIVLLCLSCTTMGPRKEDPRSFELIQLGSSAESIKKERPNSVSSTEKLISGQFQVINLKNPNGEIDISLTLDSDGKKIISKSQWIKGANPSRDLDYVLNTQFKNIAFRKFVPCHMASSKDAILINEAQGIYVAVSNGEVVLISYGTPTLTRMRIDYFERHCPQKP